MRGTLAIVYDGDPLAEPIKIAISVACMEAIAEVMVRYGFAPDSILVQG